MDVLKRCLIVLVIVELVQFAFARSAYAYLDPGSGSYILQVLTAALVGGLFVLKMYWGRVKAFLANLFSSKKGRKGKK